MDEIDNNKSNLNSSLSIEKKYGFNEKGCLFLNSVYSLDIIENINKDIRDFMSKNNIYGHLQKRHDVCEDTFFVNNTYTSLDNYKKMQYYYLPVIDNKGSHNRINEVGMIDIYNINKLIPKINEYIQINVITTILHKITGSKWKLLRTNIQICSNVSSPNSFHFESIDKCIKYTIYLSDVLNEDYGPPMFIENTHLIKNNIKNENIKTFLGNKGDVLISFQNGLHRKLPQKNTTVGFLVLNFVPYFNY
jgi:hypothetical protein